MNEEDKETSLEELLQKTDQVREKSMADLVGLEGIPQGGDKILFLYTEQYHILDLSDGSNHPTDLTAPCDWSNDGTLIAFFKQAKGRLDELTLTDLTDTTKLFEREIYYKVERLKFLSDNRLLMQSAHVGQRYRNKFVTQDLADMSKDTLTITGSGNSSDAQWSCSDDGKTLYCTLTGMPDKGYLITEGKKRYYDPNIVSVSHDGSMLLKTTQDDYVELISLSDSEPRRLPIDSNYASQYSLFLSQNHFSPDDSRACVVSCPEDAKSISKRALDCRLFILGVASGKIEYRIDCPGLSTFTWSPDGNQVAYHMWDPATQRHELMKYDLDTGETEILLEDKRDYRARPDIKWQPK